MTLTLPTAGQWAQACASDGEFALAARHWTGGLRLTVGDAALALRVDDGAVSAGEADDRARLILACVFRVDRSSGPGASPPPAWPAPARSVR